MLFSKLRKDKLHFPSSYHAPLLLTEGQVTLLLLLLPPGYGRTSYISPLANTPPPLVMEGQVTFLLLLQHPLITEGQVTVKPYGLSVGQIWPPNPSVI